MADMAGDPALWYRDAVIYELHVRSFFDSNGDGTGDFRGLTSRLAYLRDLGITALWLLPFYPSPLRDDGYDIASYTDVHANYGTLGDFRELLRTAHSMGIRVITELVLNHTSDQHPWFQAARCARPGSVQRDYYVWSDTHTGYRDARIIFQDFEHSNWTWDPVANAYYWHRFFSHQPDLNYSNPKVQREMLRVVDFWLQLGVDGIRLDAVPYLFEKEGTNCENLPETHAFLRKLRKHVDTQYEGRMLLAEANQWPEDAVMYFGDGDEAHMAFHFPLMPRMFMALQMEDRHPIDDMLRQTPVIPPACQWALFLRNHDELTLEMVTDEERDYMYRTYARETRARVNLGIRRRLAPLLGHSRRRIELMVSLLFSLPGTPVIYYGDEIGMGDNIYLGDRDALRTPMQWSADRNAGFSNTNPQRLYLPVIIDPEYHYEALNVETQNANPTSLLWWFRRMIGLRRRHTAFGRGDFRPLDCANYRVLAFIRSHENESLLCVANLSRYPQHVELDLRDMEGHVPVEVFGQNEFPAIQQAPYQLTLAGHSFLWFVLQDQRHALAVTTAAPRVTELVQARAFQPLATKDGASRLTSAFAQYVRRLDWAGMPMSGTRFAGLAGLMPLSRGPDAVMLAFLDMEGATGLQSRLLLAVRLHKAADDVPDTPVPGEIVRLRNSANRETHLLLDASADKDLAAALFGLVAEGRPIVAPAGKLVVCRPPGRRHTFAPQADPPQLMRTDSGNLAIMYGKRYVAKLISRPQAGQHPDVEMCCAVDPASRGWPHIPNTIAWIDYVPSDTDALLPMTVVVVQEYVSNHGSAEKWLSDHMERVLEHALAVAAAPAPPVDPMPEVEEPVWEQMLPKQFAPVVETLGVLGQRLAELHVSLGESTRPGLRPEPFSLHYQRSLYQSMRNRWASVIKLLRRRGPSAGTQVDNDGADLLERRVLIDACFRSVCERRLAGQRIRVHGDPNLSEVLLTGRDFVFLDFEGDVNTPLSERRIRRSPLRDLASLFWSCRVVACRSLYLRDGQIYQLYPNADALEPVVRTWACGMARALLNGYLSIGAVRPLLPEHDEDMRVLLEALVLERALADLERALMSSSVETPVFMRAILQVADGLKT